MKKNYFIILAFLCMVIFIMPNQVSAQKERLVTIESLITDENGNPIENAEIFSGNTFTKTTSNGKFSVLTEPGLKLVIEAKGYESKTVLADEATDAAGIRLKASPFLYGDDDQVDMAFRKVYAGDVVGAYSRIKADEVNTYDNTIWASNVLTGRTLGMLGSNSIRGIGIGIDVADATGSGLFSGNALFIVDGLPRDIESLRLSEIEDITVLKDVNSAILYGSAAVNGVILITTKRGEAYKTKTNISANYGISAPRELPKYLDAADYMTYYNLARTNDGQNESFSENEIENHRSGNQYRYPDVDYYSDEYLKSFKSYFDLNGQFSGGNEVAKYYSNVGWYSAGGLIDFGEWANARNNVFNVRGNVDLKINDWIKTSVDGVSLFGNNRSGRGNYWSAASNNRPHLYTPLLPFSLIDPENDLLKARKNDVDGEYLIGGNSNFITTPFGDGYAGGVYERIFRKFSFNNRIDFGLDRITKGLSFHTNISFDYFTAYDQTVYNQYSVYEPIWAEDEDLIIDLKQHGKDERPGTQSVGNTIFRRRFGFYGLLSYDRVFNDVHHFKGSLLGYGSNFKQSNDFQGVKQAHVGLQINYIFNRKYMIDFSSNYVNSVKLPEGNRGGFSPSLGVAWMMSSENFMANVDNVDYLKIRMSAGVLNSDLPIGGFFYYDNRYGGSGSYNWFEGTRSRGGVSSSWSDNPNLGFAKRNEVTMGLEGGFFDNMLGVEANVFYESYTDLVTRPNTIYPSFYTPYIPYENFESDEYRGAEIGFDFNKSIGELKLVFGVNALYVTSERTKVDEVYSNDYQYRQGHPRDASFGLEAIGLFEDQADIDNSPIQAFGAVQPGDIKYKDQNGDGIVDSNDEVYLRRWQAPFSGGIDLRLSYKNFTFYVLGEGRSGSDAFREGNYYWVDGNNKYSEVVLGSWTPETKNTATFPRLSAETDNNNFRRSSYWLYSNDYFNIRKVQLTYNVPEVVANTVFMKSLQVFVDATDVYQFAKNREIREVRVGGEPYSRTFSLGVKANF